MANACRDNFERAQFVGYDPRMVRFYQFALSGFFLWLGERDHRFIFDGTGTVHDVLTFLSVGLLVGHLYLALIHPSTRHALRGMTTGEVDESWARKHHVKWVEAENRPPLR